jgi:hypothetical protein
LGEFLENGNDVVKVGDWPGPEPWEENGTLPAIKRHTIQRDEADAAIASLERAIEKRKAEVAKHAEALSILT